MQSALDLPAAQQVTSVVLTRDEVPAATKKAMIRSALMTMAALGGMGLLLIALVDGWLTGRRDPEPEDLVVEDAAGAMAPPARCTPCTPTSRPRTGRTPTGRRRPR